MREKNAHQDRRGREEEKERVISLKRGFIDEEGSGLERKGTRARSPDKRKGSFARRAENTKKKNRKERAPAGNTATLLLHGVGGENRLSHKTRDHLEKKKSDQRAHSRHKVDIFSWGRGEM